MKYLIIVVCLFYLQPLIAQSAFLKIQAYGENYFAYPPDTEFDVIDESKKINFTEKDLSENYQIELEGDFTIKVYTDWGSGVDEFEISQATISLDQAEDYKSEDWSSANNKWFEDQPAVVKKKFKLNNSGEYDAKIEFEGDIQFMYKEGGAVVKEKGEVLALDGNYIAKTSKGYLKLSYNPSNKEYWYVFTKKKGVRKVIVKD